MSEVQETREVGGDVLLAVFARMAQEGGLSMSITLTVGGTVISGLLIGRDAWLEELAEQASEVGGLAAEFGRELQGAFQELDLSRPADDDRPYELIHLKDALYLSGDAVVPMDGRGVLWRGRISKVSGWSLSSFRR